MKRRIAALLSLAAISLPISLSAAEIDDNPNGEATESERSLPIAGIITRPDWVEKPNGGDMAKFFPGFAQSLGLSGRATIQCYVTSIGRLKDCTVLEELPVGFRFGHAGVDLAGLFRMKPETLDGQPVSGATVRIPLKFAIPDFVPLEPKVALPEPSKISPTPRAVALGGRLATAFANLEGTRSKFAKSIDETRASMKKSEATPQELMGLDSMEKVFLELIQTANEGSARAYATIFTEQELADIVAFADTPSGRTWIKRGPDVVKAVTGFYLEGIKREWLKRARANLCHQIACTPPDAPISVVGSK